ncbi:hypothetical protein ACE7GA_04605 [Roseomonas sp. CCTCC AB2023176]|uniref:hypothetical protein n=1 Tax=Roseomonas sp. CCTCC AB2023176 TaxID=3342640 RepID=UPI0035D89001
MVVDDETVVGTGEGGGDLLDRREPGEAGEVEAGGVGGEARRVAEADALEEGGFHELVEAADDEEDRCAAGAQGGAEEGHRLVAVLVEAVGGVAEVGAEVAEGGFVGEEDGAGRGGGDQGGGGGADRIGAGRVAAPGIQVAGDAAAEGGVRDVGDAGVGEARGFRGEDVLEEGGTRLVGAEMGEEEPRRAHAGSARGWCVSTRVRRRSSSTCV